MANNRLFLTAKDSLGILHTVMLAKGWGHWDVWDRSTLGDRLQEFLDVIEDEGAASGGPKSGITVCTENDAEEPKSTRPVFSLDGIELHQQSTMLFQYVLECHERLKGVPEYSLEHDELLRQIRTEVAEGQEKVWRFWQDRVDEQRRLLNAFVNSHPNPSVILKNQEP